MVAAAELRTSQLLPYLQSGDPFAEGESIGLDLLPQEIRRIAKTDAKLRDGIDSKEELEQLLRMLNQNDADLNGLPRPDFGNMGGMTSADMLQALIDWIQSGGPEANKKIQRPAPIGNLSSPSNYSSQPTSWNGSGGGTSGSAGTSGTSGTPDAAGGPVKVSGKAGDIMQRMQELDKMSLPYKWGGGHGGKLANAEACRAQGGLDCSGSVSYVLGLNSPLVSGSFGSVGSASPGADWKGVTVYYNDGHVLMSIKGDDGKEHFWGTSSSNPGGGPGWIDNPGGDYLSRFQKRYV